MSEEVIAWYCETKNPLTGKWVENVYLFNPAVVDSDYVEGRPVRNVKPLVEKED